MQQSNFRNILKGRNFSIYTDHKPLIFAIVSNGDRYFPERNATSRLHLPSSYGHQVYKRSENHLVDLMSLLVYVECLSASFSWVDIAKAQKDDKGLIYHHSSWSSPSLALKDLPLPVADGHIVSWPVYSQIQSVCPLFDAPIDFNTFTLHIRFEVQLFAVALAPPVGRLDSSSITLSPHPPSQSQ